jgi:hypothetical protein
MSRSRPHMQEHAYDHANRSRCQEHHGHLPRHDLNQTRPKATGLWRFIVIPTFREELAEMFEAIAVGGESMQTNGLVGSGQDAEEG